MRIAIVSDYFLDYVGGAQTSMLEQEAALTAAGHTVLMVSAERGVSPWFKRVRDGLRVRPTLTLPGLRMPIILNNSLTRRDLRRSLIDEKIDIVHVQTEFGLAHAAADVAAELGIPVVHTVHTFYWASEGYSSHIVAGIMRWTLGLVTRAAIPRAALSSRPVDNVLRNMTLSMALRADHLVSPSAHQARDLTAAGVAEQIDIVPNPAAAPTTEPTPLSLDGSRPPSFLWVARCEAVKRPLVFAQAAVDALAAHPGLFTVDFVGDGADLAALRRMTRDEDGIAVHGAQEHAHVLEFIDNSSAVVLSSLGFDNQPMTIAEAVMRGRGVLYCDPKLKEGLNAAGYLAESPDAAGLASALVTLASSPGLLRQLSEGALGERKLFTPAGYAERIVASYTKAMASL